MNIDAQLVGRIVPDAKGGDPVFVVLRRGEARWRVDDEMAGVQPCKHRRFILDEEWSTVTCGECKERIDPFAVLMRYAEYQETLKRERARYDQAAIRMYVGLVRQEMRRVGVTPEERAEAEDVIRRHQYGDDPDPLKACADKLEKANRERRHERRWGKRNIGGAA